MYFSFLDITNERMMLAIYSGTFNEAIHDLEQKKKICVVKQKATEISHRNTKETMRPGQRNIITTSGQQL